MPIWVAPCSNSLTAFGRPGTLPSAQDVSCEATAAVFWPTNQLRHASITHPPLLCIELRLEQPLAPQLQTLHQHGTHLGRTAMTTTHNTDSTTTVWERSNIRLPTETRLLPPWFCNLTCS